MAKLSSLEKKADPEQSFSLIIISLMILEQTKNLFSKLSLVFHYHVKIKLPIK